MAHSNSFLVNVEIDLLVVNHFRTNPPWNQILTATSPSKRSIDATNQTTYFPSNYDILQTTKFTHY